ncbi:MAG: fumarate reductase subunit C [Colwellia sp.]
MNAHVSKRKPYKQTMATNWWLQNKSYKDYMLRSATSIFILLYSVLLFSGLYALTAGESAFNDWLTMQQSSAFIVFHVITLIAVLYHTGTWFALAPKTMHVEIAGKVIEAQTIERSMWLAWVVVTVVLLAILLS